MMDKCARFFKALSDETRQKIIELLKKQEMCVSEIVDNFSIAQPSITHHLSILKNAGLIRSKKVGKQVYYFVECCCLEECCKEMMERFGIKI